MVHACIDGALAGAYGGGKELGLGTQICCVDGEFKKLKSAIQLFLWRNTVGCQNPTRLFGMGGGAHPQRGGGGGQMVLV